MLSFEGLLASPRRSNSHSSQVESRNSFILDRWSPLLDVARIAVLGGSALTLDPSTKNERAKKKSPPRLDLRQSSSLRCKRIPYIRDDSLSSRLAFYIRTRPQPVFLKAGDGDDSVDSTTTNISNVAGLHEPALCCGTGTLAFEELSQRFPRILVFRPRRYEFCDPIPLPGLKAFSNIGFGRKPKVMVDLQPRRNGGLRPSVCAILQHQFLDLARMTPSTSYKKAAPSAFDFFSSRLVHVNGEFAGQPFFLRPRARESHRDVLAGNAQRWHGGPAPFPPRLCRGPAQASK